MQNKITAELQKITRENPTPLIEFLRLSDFFTAPASSDYHLSEKGGLAQHSWNVFSALLPIARKHVPSAPEESLIICGLLHDVCKVNFYKPDFKNKKVNGKWEQVPYFAIEDKDPLGHGEKSVITLQRFINLTPDEALAIRWHMSAWDAETYSQRRALNAAIEKCPLLRALILADQFATFFIEATDKKTK